jgi:hypothetical protein
MRAIRLLLLALLILACLNFLEPRLVESHATVIIPFDDRILFVRSLNRAKFPSRLSELSQPLDPISGIQLLVGSRRLSERRLLGTVCVRGGPGVGQRRLGCFVQFGYPLTGDMGHFPSFFPRVQNGTLR